MQQEKIRTTIAERIAYYRKQMNLTQFELAEKINYSDKSVSKWERGEGVPDIYILAELAELFEVTVNDLISGQTPQQNIGARLCRKRVVITLLAIGVVWLCASLAFLALALLQVPCTLWLAWIFAIPASAIVCIVFSAMWWSKICRFFSIALLIWGLALSVSLAVPLAGIWLCYVVAAVLQVLEIVWFFLPSGRAL